MPVASGAIPISLRRVVMESRSENLITVWVLGSGRVGRSVCTRERLLMGPDSASGAMAYHSYPAFMRGWERCS